MKYLLLALVLLVAPQKADEAYPGQSEHKEPPKDWMCKRPEIDRLGKAGAEEQSHWCSCERIYDADLQWMHNDEQCAVHCHEDHCTCPVSGMKHMPENQR